MIRPLIKLSDVNKGLTKAEKKSPSTLQGISIVSRLFPFSMMAKKIGYNNFQKMKVSIAQDLSNGIG